MSEEQTQPSPSDVLKAVELCQTGLVEARKEIHDIQNALVELRKAIPKSDPGAILKDMINGMNDTLKAPAMQAFDDMGAMKKYLVWLVSHIQALESSTSAIAEKCDGLSKKVSGLTK